MYFHFGWDGSGSENRKNPKVQGKNALDGMKALEGARKLGCKRFLFSGSQAEYGICADTMGETRECHPVSEYGKAKIAFGRNATEKVRQWNQAGVCRMEYVHTRIFSVYGPGDHPWSLVNTCVDHFLQGEEMEFGACTQLWNFLYIEDLVKGLCALAFVKGLWEQDPIRRRVGFIIWREKWMPRSLCGSMWRRSARSAEERASAITASCRRMQRDRRT